MGARLGRESASSLVERDPGSHSHEILQQWTSQQRLDAAQDGPFYQDMVSTCSSFLCEDWGVLPVLLDPYFGAFTRNNPLTKNFGALAMHLAWNLEVLCHSLSQERQHSSREEGVSVSRQSVDVDAVLESAALWKSHTVVGAEEEGGEESAQLPTFSSGTNDCIISLEAGLLLYQAFLRHLLQHVPHFDWSLHLDESLRAERRLLTACVLFVSLFTVNAHTYHLVSECLTLLYEAAGTQLYAPLHTRESHLLLDEIADLPLDLAGAFCAACVDLVMKNHLPKDFEHPSLIVSLLSRLGNAASALFGKVKRKVLQYFRRRKSEEESAGTGEMLDQFHGALSRRALSTLSILLRYITFVDFQRDSPVFERTNSFATALVQLTQWEDEREVEKRRSDAGPEMRSRDSMSSVPLDAHPLTAGSVRDAEDAAHCHLSAVCAVDFREIFFAIPSTLEDPKMMFLLFELVCRNDEFRRFLLARTDVDSVVVELLRVLFVVCMDVSPSPVSSAAAGRSDSRNSSSKDGDSSPHFPPGTLHILSTILLVLSTDEPFMCRLHEIMLDSVPWYDLRPLEGISLGSLTLIVLSQACAQNLRLAKSDAYVVSNCLAAISNMSTTVHNLHDEAAQRMVFLAEACSRKLVRASSSSGAESTQQQQQSESATLGEFVHLLLVAFLHMLFRSHGSSTLPRGGAAAVDPHQSMQHALPLLHELIRRRESFAPLSRIPLLEQSLSVLLALTSHFGAELSRRQPFFHQQLDSLHLLQQLVRHWDPPTDEAGRGVLMIPPRIRFQYEEDTTSFAFFLPFVWRLGIWDPANLPWSPPGQRRPQLLLGEAPRVSATPVLVSDPSSSPLDSHTSGEGTPLVDGEACPLVMGGIVVEPLVPGPDPPSPVNV